MMLKYLIQTPSFVIPKNCGSLTHEIRIKDAVNMGDLICLLATVRTLNLDQVAQVSLQCSPRLWMLQTLKQPGPRAQYCHFPENQNDSPKPLNKTKQKQSKTERRTRVPDKPKTSQVICLYSIRPNKNLSCLH